MPVRVKICGITNLDDALAAVQAGAEALGFIFFRQSPRYVSVQTAAKISSALPPFVTKVGVFVNETPSVIAKAREEIGLDAIQLHGQEHPEVCEALKGPVIKAFRVKDASTLDLLPKYNVSAFLLDSYVPGQLGGTGEKFNWDLAIGAKKFHLPIILAGGLTPANIADAVAQVSPYAVDVSSGVEVSPGKKDHAKVQEFIRSARLAHPK